MIMQRAPVQEVGHVIGEHHEDDQRQNRPMQQQHHGLCINQPGEA